MPALINDGLPFRYADRHDLGLSRTKLRQAEQSGLVRRVFIGVYVDARAPDTREQRVLAAHLAVPGHAVVCNETASWLHGVSTWTPSDRHRLEPSYVVPHGSSRTRQRGARCRQAYIAPEDIVEIGDLQVTTPLRTASDLLRRQWRPHAMASADAIAHKGLIDPSDLRDFVHELRGYPGIRQARDLVSRIEPKTEAPSESWMRLRLIDAGLPRPEAQYPVRDVEGGQRRLDLFYVDAMLACEYDGREFHTGSRDVASDEYRRTLITPLGIRFSIATWKLIFGTGARFEQEVGEILGTEPKPRFW